MSGSFFDSDAFLETLADVHHPGRPSRVVEVGVEGRVFRLLEVGRGRLITTAPFLDFHVPVGLTNGRAPERTLEWLPNAVRRVVSKEAWRPSDDPAELPAPYVDWRRFPDAEAFEAHVREGKSNYTRDTRRRARKLARELGPLEFRFHDPSLDLVDLGLLWKSRQYRRTGLADLFANPRNAELFWELARRRLLTVSVLTTGGRPAAIHLGAVWNGRFHYWIPSFDPSLGAYSPGRLLLQSMLDESRARGHELFDFLIGDEDYKLLYATHVQEVGRIGEPPLAHRMLRPIRSRLVAEVRRFPAALSVARATKRYLVARGLL